MPLLTKSLFTTSLGCPRKLYYATHKGEYDNANAENDFLQSLADGGVQVGALSRHYYFSKYDTFKCKFIETKDAQEALRQTNELLKEKNVVIAEAAFEWNGCFVRADILVKRDSQIDLIEVKSSSVDLETEKKIVEVTKRGEVNSGYREYIYDLAFQKYVIEKALGKKVTAYLMLINSDQPCDADGLNQMIRINTKTHEVDASALEQYTPPTNPNEWLLLPCNMDNLCEAIIGNRTEEQKTYMGAYFTEYIDSLIESLRNDKPLKACISSGCKGCEFKSSDTSRSGYHRCWRECAGFTDEMFQKPHILELWCGGSFKKVKTFIAEGKYLLEDLKPSDYIGAKDSLLSKGDEEFNYGSRRQVQIEKSVKGDTEAILLPGIKTEMASWKFPLHFIDFETSTVAIPFTKDRYPYETVAFQYSHHQYDRNGRLTHTEWISTKREFPNFEFVRALKHDLEGDNGTIFRFSHHENSVLKQIAEQLSLSNEADKEELITFIHSITYDRDEGHEGERNMVDLCDVVVRYYYDPSMKGSNSIKVVLPAVLRSRELQKRFTGPYHNYVDSPNYASFEFSLINYVDEAKSEVGNPYKFLPVVGAELGDFENDGKSEERINNGGLANANYARLQYDGLTTKEKEKLKNALLRYCELDTMAMVLIYEFFKIECCK